MTDPSKLSVQIHDPKDDRQHLHVCLLPDFHLNLKTTSLLGSRAKLQGTPYAAWLTTDIPKLEQLLVARLRAVIQDRIVYPHHLTFGLPRLLSQPDPDATPVVPTEMDLRSAAVGMMSRGIGRLGQDLADRVAALGPTDSASANHTGEELDAAASTVAADDSGSSSPVIIEPVEPEPKQMPRRMPPALANSAYAGSSGQGSAHPLSVAITEEDLRFRQGAPPRRLGSMNARPL